MRLKKTTAFTLSELMVVLVISSIVISIAFLALSAVQKQIRSIQQTYEKQQEIQYIERVLLGDLNTRYGYYDAAKNELLFVNSKDTVLYQFQKNKLLRKKDTIPLALISKKMYLSGEEVKEGCIDALALYFSNTFSTNSIFVYTVKDASQYLDSHGI
jgi:prepilin-type N-terminal cleavage/methylation domain-containing protein